LWLRPLEQSVEQLEGGGRSKRQAAGKHRNYLYESRVKPSPN
jgi:hypothetical protein